MEVSMAEGDRMLADLVTSRAWTQGWTALVVGVGSLVLAAVPCAGIALPAMIWGLLTLMPMVGGLLSIAGAWQAWSTLRTAREEAVAAMTSAERTGPVVLGLVGALLGTVAGLTGAVTLAFTQIERAF